MSAVYGFNGGSPSVLLHHLCFLGEWGSGGVRKASGHRRLPHREKNEHLAAMPPRITRIARIIILVIREIRGGETREMRGG